MPLLLPELRSLILVAFKMFIDGNKSCNERGVLRDDDDDDDDEEEEEEEEGNDDDDDHSKVVETVAGVEASAIAWLALSACLIMIII